MLPVRSWRIVYADGSSFTSADGSWAAAPPFGVACVVYYHADGKTLDTRGSDDSVYEFLGGGGGAVKLGLWMDDEGFYRVHDYATRSSAP